MGLKKLLLMSSLFIIILLSAITYFAKPEMAIAHSCPWYGERLELSINTVTIDGVPQTFVAPYTLHTVLLEHVNSQQIELIATDNNDVFTATFDFQAGLQ